MKVLVVSQQQWIGGSLSTLMQSLMRDDDMETALYDVDSAVKMIQSVEVDVVLLDLTYDDLAGLAAVRRLKEASFATHIIALGSESDQDVIYQVVRAGADGYLLPDASADTVACTLRGVVRGELGLPRTAALGVVRRLREALIINASSSSVGARAKLTQREREVFDLVLRGQRSRDISRQLFIAESTVYKHIQNILDKLHMQSRAQAIFTIHDDDRTLHS